MANTPNTAIPNIIAFLFILVGLIIGFVEGISGGSIAGGIIAFLGLIPACIGTWGGMQKETQAQLGVSILMILASLGVAGILIVLRIIDWIR